MTENQIIHEDGDCKQEETDLNMVELMEVVRKEIVKVGLVMQMVLVVNLEMIDQTHPKRK